MEASRLITLTTDFGAGSCFVGIMKGVIKSLAPEVSVVDLTHTISFGNVREAAFVLSKSYRFFPENSVHVVVVDPGVGTERRIICMQRRRTLFVAPDNGVLSYVYEADAKLFCVDEETYFLKPISRTFHGRDIFAPVAALIAKGVPLLSLCSPVDKIHLIPKPQVVIEEDFIIGEVITCDSFGNLITSVEENHLKDLDIEEITFAGKRVYGPVENFEEGRDKELAAVIDSFGHLEIFHYLGSAASLVPRWQRSKVRIRIRRYGISGGPSKGSH